MLTFLAILLRILVNPISNVFQKRIVNQGQSALVANFLTYLALSVSVAPFACRIDWTSYPLEFWGYAALVGILGALGNGFLVKAIQWGELSVLGPINAYKSVVGLIFGFFLLNQIPGPGGLLGVVLIVAGSYFVLGGGAEPFSRRLLGRQDLRFRVAAMIFGAIEAVFIKKVILHSDPNVAFFAWCWGGALFSYLTLPILEKVNWKEEIRTARRHVRKYVGLIFSVGTMQFATNYAFDRIPVGYALALFQLSAVLAVFYGYLFFRETQILRKLLGSVVMVLGAVLIILC